MGYNAGGIIVGVGVTVGGGVEVGVHVRVGVGVSVTAADTSVNFIASNRMVFRYCCPPYQ
jgi:UDP-3-O-[3-hydroxymyristoyl] glucosamine N-acyltransferase